jgi:outer membrane scaffolding protein for murein synthesis (MipA/OmpV family)
LVAINRQKADQHNNWAIAVTASIKESSHLRSVRDTVPIPIIKYGFSLLLRGTSAPAPAVGLFVCVDDGDGNALQ